MSISRHDGTESSPLHSPQAFTSNGGEKASGGEEHCIFKNSYREIAEHESAMHQILDDKLKSRGGETLQHTTIIGKSNNNNSKNHLVPTKKA